MSTIMIESNSNSAQPPASNDKFVPTCEICGNKHWPFDPSCIGKKGVKEKAKKDAINAKIARKKAAIDAKNEKKRKKIDAKNEKLQIKADKIARIEAMAKAKQQSHALFSAEVKIQNEVKTRTDAEEKARLGAEKRIHAETEARNQIELQAKEIDLLNQKTQELKKALLNEKNALSNTDKNTSQIKNRHQEAITKIKIELDGVIAKEKADSARKLELQKETILRIESENERKVANLKNDFEEWMVAFKAESEGSLENERADSVKKLDMQNETIARIKNKNEQTFANLKNEYEGRIAAFKADSEQAIAFEKENSAKQAQEYGEAVSKIKSDSDRSIINIQSKCDDEIKMVRTEVETARQSLEQKFKSEMEAKATEYGKHLANARNKAHGYVEELKQVKVQMLDADIEAKKAIESKVQAEIKKRTELKAGLELEINAMAERLAMLEEQAEDEAEKRILAESQSQNQARLHAEEMAALNQNIQETENTLLKEKAALLEAKEYSVEIAAKYQEVIAKIKTEMKETIAKERVDSAKQAQEHREAISKIKCDSGRSIIDIQFKCDDETKKVLAEAETARQSLEQELKSEMEAKAGLELEIDAMVVRLAIAEEQAQDEAEKRILADSHSQDQARLHAEEMAALKQNIQEIEKAFFKEKTALLEVKEHSIKISAERQEAIAKIKTDADRSIVDIQSEYADKLNNVISEAEIARQSLEQKLKAEMEDKARDHEKALASVSNKSHSYAEELKRVRIQLKAENEARDQIEKLPITETQEQANKMMDMEDKLESFAGKIAAIKTLSERAIAEAKLPVNEECRLSAQIQQETEAKAKYIASFDYGDLDEKEDCMQSTAGENILHQPNDSLLSVYAQDIMQTEIPWCSKADSIEDALDKMEQQNTGYMLVGENGIVAGIVSKSDLKGALSPYLQPQFEKWRRPLDDATLQIRVKWVMSKPVYTVGCKTELLTILNEIRQLDVLCFPVIDENHQVMGILTKADIFDALVRFNAENSNQQPSQQPHTHSCV